MSDAAQVRSARIEPLQALRGLAAFLILSKHAIYEVSITSTLPFHFGNIGYYTIGIDIFFVLSGFIMVYTSWGKSGFAAAKDFAFRRIIRIVPIYWFYTFVMAAVALFIPQVLGEAVFVPIEFVKSLLFIPYENTVGDLQPLLANGWSLNYEMYFYSIFALCLLFKPKIGLPLLAVYFVGSVWTGFWGAPEGVYQRFYSHPIVLEFLFGAVIGAMFKMNVRLPQSFIYLGFAFLAGAIFAAVFLIDVLAAQGISYNKALISTIMVALLVLPKGAEYLRMPRWSVFCGDASYTIYLSHPFAIGAVTQAVLLFGLQGVVNPWVIFALIAAVCMVGGGIAYLLIEKPLLLLSKNYINNKKP